MVSRQPGGLAGLWVHGLGLVADHASHLGQRRGLQTPVAIVHGEQDLAHAGHGLVDLGAHDVDDDAGAVALGHLACGRAVAQGVLKLAGRVVVLAEVELRVLAPALLDVARCTVLHPVVAHLDEHAVELLDLLLGALVVLLLGHDVVADHHGHIFWKVVWVHGASLNIRLLRRGLPTRPTGARAPASRWPSWVGRRTSAPASRRGRVT